MTRIIRTGDTPANVRRAHMRSCAEVLRLLAPCTSFDDEAKDMVAFLAHSLRGIYSTIEESAHAWDKRNYWKKAEHLRHEWRWSTQAAERLEKLIREDQWSAVPDELIALIPYFSGISISTITRDADWWCGARLALLRADRQ